MCEPRQGEEPGQCSIIGHSCVSVGALPAHADYDGGEVVKRNVSSTAYAAAVPSGASVIRMLFLPFVAQPKGTVSSKRPQ